MVLKSINPANGEVVGEVEATSEREITRMVNEANEAKKLWKETPLIA